MRNLREAVLGAALVVCIGSHAAAQNDRIRDTQVGWGWLYGASPSAIDAQIAAGSRPFAFQRVAPSQYDTVFVVNSGAYAVTGADVLLNLSASALTSSLALTGKRVLDLEPYDIGSGPVFNAIVVPNSGATAASGWSWVHGQTFSQVLAWLSANPTLRMIDLDYYETGGVFRYSAVAVPNTGNNLQAASWYGTNATEDDIEAVLQANDGRLIDVEVINGGGSGQPARYAYIMIPQNGVRSDWFPAVSDAEIPDLINQYGGRIVCFERYTSFGSTRYSVVLTNNSPPQTARIRDYMAGNNGEDGGLFSSSNFILGTMGFMLKEVGGPVIASINPDFQWEPASTVKLLHAVYAIRRCAQGNDDLTDLVEYKNLSSSNPDSSCTGCPFDWVCTSRYIDLEESIRLMLEPSNNNALIALERRYGVSTLNSFANSRGFGNINLLRQDCECAVVLNTATCTDVCEMMEQVAEGSLFNQTWQDTLYRLMNDLDNQGYGLYPTLDNMIDDEAALTSLTASEIADFRDQMRYANKGGYYDCARYYKTEGGWASVPFKFFAFDTWITAPREYVFALFIHDTTVGADSDIVYSAKEEILREQVREALESWDDACSPPFVFNQPDTIARQEGDDASFSVVVGGGGDGETFRWQKGLVGGLWLNLSNSAGSITGVDTATLTLFDVDSLDAADYRVIYTSVCGGTTSQAATLTVTPPSACPGDANGDNVVDFDDITAVIANWLTAGPAGDANGDGVVNFDDINSVITNWQLSCS